MLNRWQIIMTVLLDKFVAWKYYTVKIKKHIVNYTRSAALPQVTVRQIDVHTTIYSPKRGQQSHVEVASCWRRSCLLKLSICCNNCVAETGADTGENQKFLTKYLMRRR